MNSFHSSYITADISDNNQFRNEKYIITVDCGTTNMRCRLFKGQKQLFETQRVAGVRNTAFSGTTDFLIEALRNSIKELTEKAMLNSSNIEVVISSGTLASDIGIHSIPHSIAPVGIEETAKAAELVTINEITDIPILFIPGVKTLPNSILPNDSDDYISKLESMSGEECETYGIMSMLGINGSFAIVLPGSYTKALDVDSNGRITKIKTGMCGEFIAAISENTILSHSLPHPPIQKIIPEKLCLGYKYCENHGVSPSLIKARMVRFLSDWSADEAANFFVGAALIDDIKISLELYSKGKKLIIGGSNPLRQVFFELFILAGVDYDDLLVIDDNTARLAPCVGAMAVYDCFLSHK